MLYQFPVFRECGKCPLHMVQMLIPLICVPRRGSGSYKGVAVCSARQSSGPLITILMHHNLRSLPSCQIRSKNMPCSLAIQRQFQQFQRIPHIEMIHFIMRQFMQMGKSISFQKVVDTVAHIFSVYFFFTVIGGAKHSAFHW